MVETVRLRTGQLENPRDKYGSVLVVGPMGASWLGWRREEGLSIGLRRRCERLRRLP